MHINLRTDIDTPIYQQIVDEYCAEIKSGKLQSGAKMPTVRELADEIGIARGTIKHAYDELAALGVIEMTRGRGTFVKAKGKALAALSRKEQAMNAIDTMVDKLRALNFSQREMEIYLQLRMSQKLDDNQNVRIAVVDCNDESLTMIARQLGEVAGVETYRILLDDVLKTPYKLGDSVDLVVTTQTHLAQLESTVSDSAKTAPVVLAPAQKTVVELAKISPNSRVCVLCKSDRFFDIVERGCKSIRLAARAYTKLTFGERNGLAGELAAADALILPQDYLSYCNKDEEELIRAFGREKPVIFYEYQVDAGSMMYLTQRIAQIQRGKKQKK